jgi:hypothetical protein
MPQPQTITFWPIPTRPIWGFPVWQCQEMIDQILAAMSKALASGVVQYNVGSRGLRRFTLKELQDLLAFWTAQLEAAMMGGAIVARRGIPTDT